MAMTSGGTKPAGSRSTVSSVEARRILAVLNDGQTRILHALWSPSISEYLDAHPCPVEEVQVVLAEFLRHQQAITGMLTADGELKQGRNRIELDEEIEEYRGDSRDLVRVMRKHPTYFADLLGRSLGGASARLTTMMKELCEMEQIIFATPVEHDLKNKRMLDEIRQRRKTSREYIDQLSKRFASVQADSDKKIRGKEDEMEDIKQQLAQARASEAALREEEITTEEGGTGEEQLKASLEDVKSELNAIQKADSDEEQKLHRVLRKDEETLRNLLVEYDRVMFDLTEKIKVARVDVEDKEGKYNALKSEYDEIERQRAPLKHEEARYRTETNRVNLELQELTAATIAMQAAFRKYLKYAPPITKKKKGKKKASKKKSK